jgi:hypothetical protein
LSMALIVRLAAGYRISSRSQWLQFASTMVLPASRILVAALAAGLLSACAGMPPTQTMAAAKSSRASAATPKLIVFIVVDGLPMRQVLAHRDQFQPDGLRRFLEQGAWFADAHYGHSGTVTAAGHALMLTGAYPQRSGIIANEWYEPKTGAPVYNTNDSAYRYIDHKTDPLAGTSPRMLLAETVGDVLRKAQPESKVIGISGKDRGAILPAGHLGTAYMFMGETGQFASSTYYMERHPAWVQAFNAAKPSDAFFGRSWAPLLPGYDCPYMPAAAAPASDAAKPACAYAHSVPDGQSWQVNSGNGNRLPVVLGDKMDGPGPRFYANLLPSPFADELTLNFALAAIDGEALGADAKTDILTISLSSHDYVNHSFGPESRMSHDHLLHLDRYLQGFFRDLDAKVGAGNYLLMLTSDHGFLDTPEWTLSQGGEAARVPGSSLIAYANEGLERSLGAGKWVTRLSGSGLLFDEQLIAQRGLSRQRVYAEAQAILLRHPHVAAAFTAEQLRGSAGAEATTPLLEQVRRSWHAERAAPLQLIMKEGRLFSSRTQGSSHGAPYAYDTHVPLLFWGPQWLGQGRIEGRVEIADIAPTLAAILKLRAPAQSQGKPLPLPAPAKAR